MVHTEAEDAQVVIKRSGRQVRQMELVPGENRVTVRSGEYQIELRGQSDQLELTQNQLIVRRGQRVVIRVEHRDTKQAATTVPPPDVPPSLAPDAAIPGELAPPVGLPPSSPSEPVYDGKTYSMWMAMLRNERNPQNLTGALQAFGALTDEDPQLANQSAQAIARLMRRYGTRGYGTGTAAGLIDMARQVLLSMPADSALDALKRELVEGNTRSRAFVNLVCWVRPSARSAANRTARKESSSWRR